MAIYNLLKYTEKDGIGFPMNFRRGNPNPLDNSSVHISLEAAQTYARTSPIAYVGQILSVVNRANDGTLSVDVYKIDNEAGDLKRVGSHNDDLEVDIEDLRSRLTELSDTIDQKIESAVKETNKELTDLKSIVTSNTTNIASNTSLLNTIKGDVDNLQVVYTELKDTIDQKIENAVKPVSKEVTDLKAIVTTNQSDISNMKQLITNLQSAHTDLVDTIDQKIEDKVSDLRSIVSSNSTTIDAIKKDYLTSADKRSLLDTISLKVDQSDYEQLVSKVDANTTSIGVLTGNSTVEGSVDYKIEKAFNDFMTTETADEVVNTYKELITYVKNHGPEAANMSSLINRLETQVSENATRLDDLESSQQNSLIKRISINKVDLPIVDNAVDIPIATSELFGVVKSSTEENKIIIHEDGAMEVNSINFNKLVQTEGDLIILDGSSWLLNSKT